MVWNLFPFKSDFSFGKSQMSQGTKSVLYWIWVTWVIWLSPQISVRAMMPEQAHCRGEAASHQLPIAAAFWVIQIVSAEECANLSENWMQICCSTQSFWIWWPHSTHAHSMASMAPRTSIVTSSLFMLCIPVHPPWLPGYVGVAQTVLVMVAMAGF